ncbi:hypothetical protein CY35_02G200100 [Sphagnum magellanicum]|nr:hypothetical protein CY35_02G200100 [Sphagnum magellanicum]
MTMMKLKNGAYAILLVAMLAQAVMSIDAAALEASVGVVCNAALLELVPCSDSIMSGKQGVGSVGAPPPDPRCCKAMEELMLTPKCLCFAAGTADGFDEREVLDLPAACNLNVQPGQFCNGKYTLQAP